MNKDISKLKNNNLIKALDEILEKMKIRDEKEKNYSLVKTKISNNKEKISSEKSRLGRIKPKQEDDFISEELYIDNNKKNYVLNDIHIRRWFIFGLVLSIFIYILASGFKYVPSDSIFCALFLMIVIGIIFLSFKRFIIGSIFLIATIPQFSSTNFSFSEITWYISIPSIGVLISFSVMFIIRIIKTRIINNKKNEDIQILKEQYKTEYEEHLIKKEKKDSIHKEEYKKQKEFINKRIETLEKEIEDLKIEEENKLKELESAKDEADKFCLSIHKDYRTIDIILKFKEYLEKGLCDDLKECKNLYEDEKRNENIQSQINVLKNDAEKRDSVNQKHINDLQIKMNLQETQNEFLQEEMSSMKTNMNRIDIEQKAKESRTLDQLKEYSKRGKKDYVKEYKEEMNKYREQETKKKSE